MSTYPHLMTFNSIVSGIAASIGVRAFDAAGTALAARQTGTAVEEVASVYTVSVTLDTTWAVPFKIKADNGTSVIAVEVIDAHPSDGAAAGGLTDEQAGQLAAIAKIVQTK